jgi:hypothetical protein
MREGSAVKARETTSGRPSCRIAAGYKPVAAGFQSLRQTLLKRLPLKPSPCRYFDPMTCVAVRHQVNRNVAMKNQNKSLKKQTRENKIRQRTIVLRTSHERAKKMKKRCSP